MRRCRVLCLALVAAGVQLPGLCESTAPLRLVQAAFFGTESDDDIQGGCSAPDGTIYIAGNTGASQTNVPGGAKPSRFGGDSATPRCGHGFVARLSADGSNVLAYAEFGKGILSLTTVQANTQGVYVAGYATDALEPLLKSVPGLMRDYPLRKEVRLVEEGKWVEAVGEDTTKPDPILEKNHGRLGRYGAPCVLRLSADLSKMECGTYLEGWQQVWTKHRQIGRTRRKKMIMVSPESSWQPTHLAVLRSDEVLVCHDGGYFRLLTPEDRALVDKSGVPRLAHRLGFYDVCDHLSKLSPDLAQRVYRKPIYTPATDLETARRIKGGWPYPHFSNPRTLNMVLDKEENAYLSGWSASATINESWWSPYIWKMKAADGSLIRKIEETDPMSGPDNRMNGSVADRGIGAVALDGEDLLYSSLSDGGFAGVIHFSGTIFRVDEKTKTLKAAVKTSPCFWVVGMTALPQKHVLAVGRCNLTSQGTADAWQQHVPEEEPQAWLRVYGPDLKVLFSTAVRGVVPTGILPLSETRFLLVGTSRGTLSKVTVLDETVTVTQESNPGVAVVRSALFDKPCGGSDGYFMIVEWQKTPVTGAQP